MSGIRLTMFEREARLVLDKALAGSVDLSPVMLAIAGEVDDRTQESFTFKRSPLDGSEWPELKAATRRDRERRGYNPGDTLQRTRILRSSVVTEASENAVEVADGGVEYAVVHQFGAPARNIPARTFAGASAEDLAEFEEWIAEHIAGP